MLGAPENRAAHSPRVKTALTKPEIRQIMRCHARYMQRQIVNGKSPRLIKTFIISAL